jgi:hypothetical protein
MHQLRHLAKCAQFHTQVYLHIRSAISLLEILQQHEETQCFADHARGRETGSEDQYQIIGPVEGDSRLISSSVGCTSEMGGHHSAPNYATAGHSVPLRSSNMLRDWS